ncbi:MAG: SMC-Scp complex subunit ScpB [Candidatus Magasanikbacteria bacterium RIFOXYD2_FULL_39_9]|uniref:SMC-Scp complex subunit ScpB n=1 Tax=Candidatus Magasanikbacteria bacterium RIFOXYD1_FULL_40_23 TaxID=1798705 RepID=A0A1F6P840_9BACT|nr:MAG: SMC-Scp complex subunit ScpB [Candidatus Magasanikbacteria bacterium RIFOXYD1_FULL_40_23]OGH92992.1 MAG: SMC-Scp complex subunit ScpB [Candidatus Magasanikbacteria bacterium RIFOXYD2_FULL_39_9]
MSIQSKIESILFVASKPLQAKKIASILKSKEVEVNDALQALQSKYNGEDSGVVLIKNNDEWQMAANPDNRQEAENFMKAEVSGELTRPQLETLTVVSYCGPITKPELEQIRGVNCSLILRNLMLRGLVKENEDVTNLLPTYETTMEYLRHMGINSLEELPNYSELHAHPYITSINQE